MTTSRRIRNVAFLALLVTLVWAGPVTLRADYDSTTNSSGGVFCAYGDCEIHWTNCPGTWHWYTPDHESAPPYTGSCTVQYEPDGEGCDVESTMYVHRIVSGSSWKWIGPDVGGGYFWYCVPINPE